MIEPASYYFNAGTAATNHYQFDDNTDKDVIYERALTEFRSYRDLLVENGVFVTTMKGIPESPDHIFCNWMSTHENREFILYPMMVDNRRMEKTPEMIATLKAHYDLKFDWSHYEEEGRYLESTGSLVLDRVNKKAYIALSQRTDEGLAREWCKIMHYEPVIFNTHDHTGAPVYHTDVVMFVGSTMAGICADALEPGDRGRVMDSLRESREIVEIAYDQMQSFTGNALEVLGNDSKPMLALSQSAFESLTAAQKSTYEKHFSKLLYGDIATVQQYGGGSARCMIQELF